MPKLIFIVIVPAVLAAGCAAQPTEIAPAASQAASAPPVVAMAAAVNVAPAAVPSQPESLEVKTVAYEELDNGLVCEPRQRSASRITRRVCYTREEYAVVQEQQREHAQEYARDLSRDQEWREAQQRAEQERRRSGMAGF